MAHLAWLSLSCIIIYRQQSSRSCCRYPSPRRTDGHHRHSRLQAAIICPACATCQRCRGVELVARQSSDVHRSRIFRAQRPGHHPGQDRTSETAYYIEVVIVEVAIVELGPNQLPVSERERSESAQDRLGHNRPDYDHLPVVLGDLPTRRAELAGESEQGSVSASWGEGDGAVPHEPLACPEASAGASASWCRRRPRAATPARPKRGASGRPRHAIRQLLIVHLRLAITNRPTRAPHSRESRMPM